MMKNKMAYRVIADGVRITVTFALSDGALFDNPDVDMF